jgi:hypothetical protein
LRHRLMFFFLFLPFSLVNLFWPQATRYTGHLLVFGVCKLIELDPTVMKFLEHFLIDFGTKH